MTLYCLRSKLGTLFPDTISAHRSDVWGFGGFETVAAIEGSAWREKFWHRPAASKASARRAGYRIVKVKLVEVGK